MTYYQLHPLNARHGLTAVLPGLRATVADAVRLTQAHAALPDFDVTVRVDPERCIPGWGAGLPTGARQAAARAGGDPPGGGAATCGPDRPPNASPPPGRAPRVEPNTTPQL